MILGEESFLFGFLVYVGLGEFREQSLLSLFPPEGAKFFYWKWTEIVGVITALRLL